MCSKRKIFAHSCITANKIPFWPLFSHELTQPYFALLKFGYIFVMFDAQTDGETTTES